MEFKETKSFIEELIENGTNFLSDINDGDKRALIAIFICELDKNSALFDGYEPSRFMVSRFIEMPTSHEAHDRMIDEISQSIFSSHQSHLQEMFDDVLINRQIYTINSNYNSDINDWKTIDIKDRMLDLQFI